MEVHQLLQRSRVAPPPFLQSRYVHVSSHPVAEDAEKIHPFQVGGHVAPRECEPHLAVSRDQELEQRREAAKPRRLHELDRPEVQDYGLPFYLGSSRERWVQAT
jgi:hypothetical protein